MQCSLYVLAEQCCLDNFESFRAKISVKVYQNIKMYGFYKKSTYSTDGL